ncbi:MAG: cyclic nucleotide-binding domain-containing protein [Verrucomicrobiota bacterium]|nr:cyclic nucleotide-binding domain-containing protein [Verrucomicrobiota bacterium]
MSTPAEICAKLAKEPLFAEFTSQEVEQFVSLMEVKQARLGEIIVRQDEIGDCMYIVLEGSAKVVHHKEGHHIELATIKDGDFFGELSLVDQGPRSADVEALSPCTLLRVEVGSLLALSGVYPRAAFKFLIATGRILVNRLRRGNQRYIDSLLFPLAGKD